MKKPERSELSGFNTYQERHFPMATCTVYHAESSASTLLPHYLQATLSLLSNLTRQRGYCYAYNATLATMRGVHEATIGRHIKALRDAGFIRVEFIGPDRRIFLCPMKRSRRVPPAYPQRKPVETEETTNTPESVARSTNDPANAEKPSVVVPQCQKSPKNDNSPMPVVRSDNTSLPGKPSELTVTAEKVSDAVRALQKAGVAPPIAHSLAAQYAERAIVEAIRRYKETPGAKGVGWLVAAIRGSWEFGARKVDTCPHRYVKAPSEPPIIVSGSAEDVRSIVEGIRARTGILRRGTEASYPSAP